MNKDQTTIDELNRLIKMRQGVVGVAFVLLIAGWFIPNIAFAFVRSFAWVVAGGLSFMVASKQKSLGHPAGYGQGLLYLLVALFPLLRGR